LAEHLIERRVVIFQINQIRSDDIGEQFAAERQGAATAFRTLIDNITQRPDHGIEKTLFLRAHINQGFHLLGEIGHVRFQREAPRGSEQSFATSDEIVDKFRKLTRAAMPKGQQDALVQAVALALPLADANADGRVTAKDWLVGRERLGRVLPPESAVLPPRVSDISPFDGEDIRPKGRRSAPVQLTAS
jgi:hypothetical protein